MSKRVLGASVPARLNEMAILFTAKAWSSQFEWHAHKPLALQDLIAVMGYYDLISMVLNVDRYPMPDGVPPPFPEPK